MRRMVLMGSCKPGCARPEHIGTAQGTNILHLKAIMMRFSKFTAGLVSGFVLGLLLAPEKGEETRKKVRETAGAWKHRLNNLFGKGEGELDELKDILENEAESLSHEVRQKLLRLVEENRKTYQEARQQSLS